MNMRFKSVIESNPLSEIAIHQIFHWIMRNEEEICKDFNCIRCGACCLIYSQEINNLSANSDDLERWEGELVDWRGKTYLLTDFVDYFFELGNGDLWFHPETHDELHRCPFLRKEYRKKVYTCLIQEIKPNMCKDYPGAFNFECKGIRQLIKEGLHLKFHSIKEEAKFWIKLEKQLKD